MCAWSMARCALEWTMYSWKTLRADLLGAAVALTLVGVLLMFMGG